MRIRNIACRPYYSGIEPVTFARVEIHLGEDVDVSDAKAAQMVKDYPGRFVLLNERGEPVDSGVGSAPAIISNSAREVASEDDASPSAPAPGSTEAVAQVLNDSNASEQQKAAALAEEEDFGGPPRRKRGRR